MKQQIDKLGAEAASSRQQQGNSRVYMSTSSGSLGSSSSTETGSSEEESSSSGVVAAAAAASTAAKVAAAAAASKPAPATQKAAGVQQAAAQVVSSSRASVSPAPPPQQQQQQVHVPQAPQPKQQQQPQQQVVQQPAAQQLPQQQQQLAVWQEQAALEQQQQQQSSEEVSPQKDIEPQYAGLARLVRLFDADRLAGQTELLDLRGTKLREGSMIMFTAHPTGALMVQGEEQKEQVEEAGGQMGFAHVGLQSCCSARQAVCESCAACVLPWRSQQLDDCHCCVAVSALCAAAPAAAAAAVSPGLVKEQRSYLLGSVFDPQLTRALMSMFMDPDHTLDPEFTAAAGATLLAFVNGARQGQAQAVVPVVPGGSLEDGRRLLRHGKWRLPALGQAPEQDTVLSGVRRAVVYQQVRAV